MRKRHIIPIAATAMAWALANAAAAQDVGTQTTPEVRDFRLDPQPAPAEPKSEAPVAVPPPDAAAPSPAPSAAAEPTAPRQSAVRARQAEAPTNRRNVPISSGGAEKAATAEGNQAPPSDADAVQPAADAAASTAAATPPASEPTPAQTGGWSAARIVDYWPWLAGALALLIALAYWLRRERRSAKADDHLIADFGGAESNRPEIAPQAPQPQPAKPVTTDAPKPPVRPQTAPALSAQFTPETANLSLANLTIAGKLVVRNDGNSPIAQLAIRTAMISAMDGQQDRIAQFHADPTRGHSETIGGAAAGEEIALAIEIQMPRSELNIFDWRERQFLAPIVLANISGVDSEKQAVECRLSCLVGREAQPPLPRMKPFHIDRGPRRFDNLGFRPVSA